MNFIKKLFSSQDKKSIECFNEIKFILIAFRNKYQKFDLPTYGLDTTIEDLKDYSSHNWNFINKFLRQTKSWKIDSNFALSVQINLVVENMSFSLNTPYSSFIKDVTNLQEKIIEISQKFSFTDKILYKLQDI